MSQQKPPSAPGGDTHHGDPWQAFGYLVAGVLLYGFVGWLVDRWLGTSFVVGIGIVVGAGLGLYMTFVRFTRSSPPAPPENGRGDGAPGRDEN